MLADEALSYNGLYLETQGELAKRCVELVAAAVPDLVNATDEYGFTPLISAARSMTSLLSRLFYEPVLM